MPFKQYIRRHLYRWHRIASLIIALPVLLWAVSGFMHPLMTNIRPQVATQRLMAPVIDTSKIKISLAAALQKNHMDTFRSFRLVAMNDNWFYQVQLPGSKVLKYYSADNGKLLPQGDELYARYLAKQFLEGDEQAAAVAKAGKMLVALKPEPLPDGSTTDAAEALSGDHDCCTSTMAAIMNNSKGAKVNGVTFIEQFDKEYKYVNRYLPAYRVSFDRADGIRIYVETAQDRFAFATDNNRYAFDTFFALFHTLSWLDVLGKGKHVVEIGIMALAMFTTVMGLYIFFTTKSKKPNGNLTVRARRIHRITSLSASLFTLLFTFSGAFHAWEKLQPDTRRLYETATRFSATQAAPDWQKLHAAVGEGKLITNVSLVNMPGGPYWQVFHKGLQPVEKKAAPAGGKDLMKSMNVPPPNTLYIQAADYTVLPSGEQQYARYLATTFSGRQADKILSVTPITRFAGEYGFVNKRLPVWKVGYAENSKERYYVETGSGKLAALVNDNDLAEGYSFALFHKHHFMDWGGKTLRDISTMFWAFMQVLMVGVGLWFWMKVLRRPKAAR
ncbi:PepSY domain-containing protein [Pseudoflavitalea sp. X16]|uniref:PepSY domain-containing protein n=1 Tax=Paraflavitalea devenefica TaxID=2716334 RepID=UPI00141E0770|nr:PepSY domain-containing protein [Paraflavitalea devenefica]NII26607.1 PepSY domain-containing protein [Paraflavitalea devenefica]